MKLNGFIDKGSDILLIKSLCDSGELTQEDLEKAFGKRLALVEVQVQGKHGIYTRKQWKLVDKTSKSSDLGNRLHTQNKELQKKQKQLNKQQKKLDKKTSKLDKITNKYLKEV